MDTIEYKHYWYYSSTTLENKPKIKYARTTTVDTDYKIINCQLKDVLHKLHYENGNAVKVYNFVAEVFINLFFQSQTNGCITRL
jgi:hypothetical protein